MTDQKNETFQEFFTVFEQYTKLRAATEELNGPWDEVRVSEYQELLDDRDELEDAWEIKCMEHNLLFFPSLRRTYVVWETLAAALSKEK